MTTIITKPVTPEYEESWDRVFLKKAQVCDNCLMGRVDWKTKTKPHKISSRFEDCKKCGGTGFLE